MKVFPKIVLVVLVLFILLQFIPRSINRSDQLSSDDISNRYPIPEQARNILQKACYDCHSNNTHYPWYAQIQPFRLVLDRHVKEGKTELNFSEFGVYSRKRQYSKMSSISESIGKGTMPLSSYTAMHPEARLSESEKTFVMNWMDELRSSIKANDKN